ncbi:MAG: TIGR03790 family protein [Desulfococcaceae bacterium]
MNHTLFISILLLALSAPLSAAALEPEDILLIANGKNKDSVRLAHYYMEQRKIPLEHLLILDVRDQEECTREEYREKILMPVREYLSEVFPCWRIRCLLLVYGMPLRILTPPSSEKSSENQDDETESLFGDKGEIEDIIKNIIFGKNTKGKETDGILDRIRQEVHAQDQKNDLTASPDSELALVYQADYPLKGWVSNPYYAGNHARKDLIPKENVLMVSRLDGPDPETVKRIIDDSISTESEGLRGSAYFDARWPDPGQKTVTGGYRYYDRSLHRAAAFLKEQGRMPVKVNDAEALFQKGECPDAALYCGWYSLGKYADSFTWRPGSVGYHIASSECATLKKPGSQVWCKRMLEKGIAATIGPVGEPYVGAFPLPELFFRFLSEGYLELAESYFVSLPYLSWKMVLIGDPLYHPFSPVLTMPENF